MTSAVQSSRSPQLRMLLALSPSAQLLQASPSLAQQLQRQPHTIGVTPLPLTTTTALQAMRWPPAQSPPPSTISSPLTSSFFSHLQLLLDLQQGQQRLLSSFPSISPAIDTSQLHRVASSAPSTSPPQQPLQELDMWTHAQSLQGAQQHEGAMVETQASARWQGQWPQQLQQQQAPQPMQDGSVGLSLLEYDVPQLMAYR